MRECEGLVPRAAQPEQGGVLRRGAELVSCEDIALVAGPLGRSLRIHNLTWARGGEVEPGGLVYRTHRGEEAVLTRGRHTGRYSLPA